MKTVKSLYAGRPKFVARASVAGGKGREARVGRGEFVRINVGGSTTRPAHRVRRWDRT